jgi:hypothetical protein
MTAGQANEVAQVVDSAKFSDVFLTAVEGLSPRDRERMTRFDTTMLRMRRPTNSGKRARLRNVTTPHWGELTTKVPMQRHRRRRDPR